MIIEIIAFLVLWLRPTPRLLDAERSGFENYRGQFLFARGLDKKMTARIGRIAKDEEDEDSCLGTRYRLD